MPIWEVTNTQRSVTKNASAFFDKLEKKVQDRADRIIHDHVLTMRDTLRFRKPLGVADGRYPRWDALGGDKEKSKGSYQKWMVAVHGKGKYKLFNNAQDPATGYAYPLNLVNGTGWRGGLSAIIGEGKPRLTHHNGKLFSKQMPRGLSPWLGRKRTQLKNKLKTELGVKL